MENLKSQFNLIETSKGTEDKAFVVFYNINIDLVEKEEMEEGAYHICGVASLEAESLKTPDIQNIIDMACQLELPEPHRAVNTGAWSDLVKAVKAIQ